MSSPRSADLLALVIGILVYPSSSAAYQSERLAQVSPRRIVSLVPSATDILVALGNADRLVARTDFDLESSVLHLPSVGGTIDPSLERIVRLQPDLVLTWDDSSAPGLRRRLERAGLNTETLHSSTLADLRENIRRLGAIVTAPHRADSLLHRIESGLDSVRRESAAHQRVRVFYLVWSRPLMTTGGGTFIDSLIAIAGGHNVFGDLRMPWPAVSIENVIDRAPDVILWPRKRADRPSLLADDPLWGKLQAVRSGHVRLVDGDLVSRPGPRVVQAARAIQRLLEAQATGR